MGSSSSKHSPIFQNIQPTTVYPPYPTYEEYLPSTGCWTPWSKSRRRREQALREYWYTTPILYQFPAGTFPPGMLYAPAAAGQPVTGIPANVAVMAAQAQAASETPASTAQSNNEMLQAEPNTQMPEPMTGMPVPSTQIHAPEPQPAVAPPVIPDFGLATGYQEDPYLPRHRSHRSRRSRRRRDRRYQSPTTTSASDSEDSVEDDRYASPSSDSYSSDPYSSSRSYSQRSRYERNPLPEPPEDVLQRTPYRHLLPNLRSY
ncbi:hypothetical protein DENSPDRAFT_833317 [Dentipellis sp. KUC8613]|nr:hypothetical protein DENSPDRAFT_833317 [Dentipellis sp. KUC8613]